MKTIKSKYVEYLLAPANAITDTIVETADGVKCKLEYQATWNNEFGRYDAELDDMCQKYYNSSLPVISNIWIGRLGFISEYWHLVKMVKID